MSREVMSAVIRGAQGYVKEAETKLAEAKKKHGADFEVTFPETAFYLPMAYSLMGIEAKTAADLETIVEHAKELTPEVPTDALWLPYLGDGLDAGIAAMLAMEVTCALRYLDGEKIPEGYQGFISDTILRELGIQLVDGRMPGFAAILGPAPTEEIAVKTVRELQKRNILTFLIASRDGKTMTDQLRNQGVELGWDTYIVPAGPDVHSGIYVLDWAIRGALTFGGHKKGEWRNNLRYTRERVFAFGITFGPIPDEWYALGAGAIAMGFPVISDHESTPEVRPTGVTTYEALVRQTDYEQLVPTCIEVRGVKVKVSEIDIPVAYAAAFEGERVRREDLHIEFGGKKATAFEYLRMKDLEEVEDGKIELIGEDIDKAEVGTAMDLGIMVEVAGRKMQRDFEGILERQIHRYINEATGVMHIGQRNLAWIRLSKSSFAAGFRLKHIGTILHAMLHEEYGGILDKVQVTLSTKSEDIKKRIEAAKDVYAKRDARVAGMTDESVNIFYSCTLCQSFAPNHVCAISPERLGLCGAYNWLDGKASYEINPTGPNQPVQKGEVLDPVLGQFKGVNEFVYKASRQTIDHYNFYSVVHDPMTTCGCCECIAAVLPGCNGVMTVHRDYTGMTPCGMKFSTLAGVMGGGQSSPGFVGHGKFNITQRKFILGDGGLLRMVWMPKSLKEEIKERLDKRAEEMGVPDLYDKIADETVGIDEDSVMAFLKEKDHPALKMDPIVG